MNFVASRSLVYIRQNPEQKFLEEIEPDIISKLKQASHLLYPGMEFCYGKENNVSYFHFNFPSLEVLRVFTNAIYLKGEIKDLFKYTMVYAKKNKFAFYSPTTNLLNLAKFETTPYNLKRNFFMEIKKSNQKFHATTVEHKNAIPLYSDLLELEKTICISAFYDFEDNIRHVQTLFGDFDLSFEEKSNQVYKKYDEYFNHRNHYNRENGIRMMRGFGDSYVDKPLHAINELFHLLPDQLKKIELKLVY